jgi:hypothetical protein
MVSAKGRTSSSYFAYYPHIALWIMRKMFSHLWHASKMMHGSYGETYESQCPHMDDTVHPKTTIVIWDTGSSFGLTPFWSDFIDYVK